MALSDKHPLWRSPRHHLDLSESSNHVHWIELFFDLIHVVVIFMLGNFLANQHDIPGFIAFIVIFSAVWLAWAETSIYNSLYVSTDWKHLVAAAFQTLSVLFIAASIPALEPSFIDPGKGFPYFLAAYGFSRLILAVMYHRAIKTGAEKTSLAREQSLRLFSLAALYFIAAFLPAPYSLWVFIFGVVLTQLFYFIPQMTVMRLVRFRPRLVHFSERFALLLLIVNGEGFFKLVVTLADKGIYNISFATMCNVSVGCLAIFSLTWIYFDSVGYVKPRVDKHRYLYTYWLGHLSLMMASVMVGVSQSGAVYVGFIELFPAFYGTLGTFGLAQYLLSIMLIQWSVERQTAHRFVTPKIQIAGIAIALLTFFMLPYAPSVLVNSLWASAILLQLVVPVVKGFKVLTEEEGS